jgi:hypothetical protein
VNIWWIISKRGGIESTCHKELMPGHAMGVPFVWKQHMMAMLGLLWLLAQMDK